MQVYFAPLACSAATRIALYEAGATADFVYVDIHTRPGERLLADGSDYRAINPMGQVPAIRTSSGEVITENPVVLQYVADLHPHAQLAPAGGMERYRLQQWLNFIATELHKGTYIPLLDRRSPDGAKAFARQKLALRFGYLSQQLAARPFLLGYFSVADAYLITVLNWSPYAGIDLAQWPQIEAYAQALKQRPAVARALAEETAAYAREMNH
ncbi:glutathione S-transferase family protein [Silvimonas iriomotensis]|uniref:Glutathione S-transferase n=1 Tax=Silvimonas iriomotensis TaxID=449662 RepID=A0ABQ2PA14_9NEIS|nr:glutathione S-transferase family protein [Silvimonas iriomotensis]GGP21517.1 glutathione S-transferase [Silvimonas iriomotensis]